MNGILLQLDIDCRISYESLARKFGVSSNAIKRRVGKMVECGVIEEYAVILSPAMTGAQYMMAFLHTDGSENTDLLVDHLGKYPMIVQVTRMASGSGGLYQIYAEYVGPEGLSELGRFLRTTDGINDVEIHTLLQPQGSTMELSRTHLRVLRCLLQDARMPIKDVAECTGMTARRIRRILNSLVESESVQFRVRWDLGAGGSTQFFVKTEYNQREKAHEEMDVWLEEAYPDEFWYSYASAVQPVIYANFVVDHLREVDRISREIRSKSFVAATASLISYPVKKFPRVGMARLEEMLTEANL
ncbi:MAG: winged helix-turn-helix transcriptional regulator [Candidatus Thorarchaeota archaeon]